MITIVSVGPHYQLHVPLTKFSVLYSRLVIENAFVQRHCFPFTRIRNTLTSITKSCHVDFLLTLNMSLCLYVRVCALTIFRDAFSPVLTLLSFVSVLYVKPDSTRY